jgi:ubiquinone biosynthesis protein COQ4
MADGYKVENKPRGVFRFGLAVWRLLKNLDNLDANIEEAGIVELTFNRSRWGRKIARWDLVAAEAAAQDPAVAAAISTKHRLERIELDQLKALPPGTFGHEFAVVQIKRGVDPNLVDPLPGDTDGEWLMAHMYETHDFWHFICGFGFDMEGECGVGGVYMAQQPKNTFFSFMLAMIALENVWKNRDKLPLHVSAFCRGYDIGRKARPLTGLDWQELWARDLEEVREELGISAANRPDTIPLAA